MSLESEIKEALTRASPVHATIILHPRDWCELKYTTHVGNITFWDKDVKFLGLKVKIDNTMKPGEFLLKP
jgi:hypothetical protein